MDSDREARANILKALIQRGKAEVCRLQGEARMLDEISASITEKRDRLNKARELQGLQVRDLQHSLSEAMNESSVQTDQEKSGTPDLKVTEDGATQ